MKVEKLVNLTPHPVIILTECGELVLEPCKSPLRLPEHIYQVDEIEYGEYRIPLVEKTLLLKEFSSLPQIEGVFYIVPLVVAQLCPRTDFLVPDDLIRDGQGRVIGAKRLALVRKVNLNKNE